jgi:hypothetical protein
VDRPLAPGECRERAAECVRLIRRSKAPRLKAELRLQAAKWLKMAAEMERADWPRSDAPEPQPK